MWLMIEGVEGYRRKKTQSVFNLFILSEEIKKKKALILRDMSDRIYEKYGINSEKILPLLHPAVV